MPILVNLVNKEYNNLSSNLAMAIKYTAYKLITSLLYFKSDLLLFIDHLLYAWSSMRLKEIRGQI